MANILIVDDDRSVITYLQFLLKMQGYSIEGETTPKDAFLRMGKNPPDLVLVDLLLQTTTGYEVLRKIRSNPKLHSIPVILYTASKIDASDKANALAIGADDFLRKPFDTRELLAKIKRLLSKRSDEVQDKQIVRETFRSYISKEIIDVLLAKKGNVVLEGEKRTVTVLFSDIREFTRLSEKLQPSEIVEMLNEYLKMMSGIIRKYDGVIDKFMGDAIMAFWNAPFDQKNHEVKAARCAIEMLDQLKKYNAKRKTLGQQTFENIGIGINTGPVVAGLIGSERKMEYTLIGDTVNFTARLQAQAYNKIYISQTTYNAIKEICKVKSLGKMKFKGKEGEIEVYELEGLLW